MAVSPQPQDGADAQAAKWKSLNQLAIDRGSLIADADPQAIESWVNAHGTADFRSLMERIETTSNELLTTANGAAANGDTAGAEN